MKFFFFCLLYLVCIDSFTQEFDKQNIYYQALKLHFEYIEKSHEKRPDLLNIADIYYVEKNDSTTKGFPDSIMGHNIEILSLSDIKEKTQNKQLLSILAVRPAQWKDSKLIIDIITFSVSRKGNNYSYINLMDGTSYQIVYNSDVKEYSLIPLK